jgi:hypothetical protein
VAEQKDNSIVPCGKVFKKGITIGFGRDPNERYTLMLRNMIGEGTARPGQIAPHRVLFPKRGSLYAA